MDKKTYLKHLSDSYKRFLNKELPCKEDLFNADFVCASHIFDEHSEAKFFFANKQALDLWELSLEEFIGSPSKQTAEEHEREDRKKLLDDVQRNGFIENYSGIRISSKGKRFLIKKAIVWNVIDDNEKLIGQAVKFDDYEFV